MRTTLDIDDDVLLAAKERARREHRSTGAVISELAREALVGHPPTDEEPEEFFGFRPLPKRGVIVTRELVQQLIDEDEG